MSLPRPPRRPLALRHCALAVLAALAGLAAVPAHAENLLDVYRQALQADPVLKQAEAQSRIGHEGLVQSRAALLPQISGRVQLSDSHGSQTSAQRVLLTGGSEAFLASGGHSEGRSRNASVGLDQTLFDFAQLQQWRAASASAGAAAAQYAAAQQNLVMRVAQAYFTVLSDEDQLKFAEANSAALKKQLDQAQAKYDVGFAAITDVADARAQYDTALATVISAKNSVFNDREALAQITGQATGGLDPLRENLPTALPEPNDMQAWVKTALVENPALQAQREQVDAARHQVGAAYAGHLPTLGASVNYSRNPSWGPGGSRAGLPANVQDILHANSQSNNTTVGLVLTVPLFAGGATQSRVRQAIAQRDQASEVLEQNRRTVESNTRNAFNAIEAGISSVDAHQQAVISAKTALDATQAGYDIGTQTIVNLLIAQSNYFSALSAYSQARHALVINQLNLKFAAGTLSVADLKTVNGLLQ